MAKRNKVFTVIYYAVVCALLLGCTLSLFLVPITGTASGNGEQYLCVWENGETSAETYASACRSLSRIDENGNIVLERDGREGIIFSERLAYAESVLLRGSLAELLSLEIESCNAIERAALARAFSDTVYYSEGDAFRFTQSGIVRTDNVQTKKLALVTSSLPLSLIRRSGAEEVLLYPQTIIKPQMFINSSVTNLIAREPYYVQNGVLYLKTVSGVRCVAALPSLKEVAIEGNDFADEGALLPCKNLEELTVSFAGNDKNTQGTLYRGELAHLFSSSGGYDVPTSLKRVKVTGGKLISHAFYACSGVEEIDLCGLDWKDVDRYAAVDCKQLKTLHTPRRAIALPEGEFERSDAPCGCVIYTRCERE